MWTTSGGKHTIKQVTKLEKLLSGTDLQIQFHNLTILLKYEAWNAEVLQIGVFKVDGTSFSDAGSLVTTAHLTREICPRKSKTNMGAQKWLLTRVFFPVCPRLDQNKSCPLGVSC